MARPSPVPPKRREIGHGRDRRGAVGRRHLDRRLGDEPDAVPVVGEDGGELDDIDPGGDGLLRARLGDIPFVFAGFRGVCVIGLGERLAAALVQIAGTIGLNFFTKYSVWQSWHKKQYFVAPRKDVAPAVRIDRWDSAVLSKCKTPGCVVTRVTDPLAGKPIDLRECPRHQHIVDGSGKR